MQEENEVFQDIFHRYEVICIQAKVFLNFKMFLHFYYCSAGNRRWDQAKQESRAECFPELPVAHEKKNNF